MGSPLDGLGQNFQTLAGPGLVAIGGDQVAFAGLVNLDHQVLDTENEVVPPVDGEAHLK
jgi:hypothetical protein